MMGEPYCPCCELPLVAPEYHGRLIERVICATCGKEWLPGADAYHVIACPYCKVMVCYESECGLWHLECESRCDN